MTRHDTLRAAAGVSLAATGFAGLFLLHIAGGASGLRWLFWFAVAGIFLSAAGMGVVSAAATRLQPRSAGWVAALAAGSLLGIAALTAALWAANGRTFAWWELPTGTAIVLAADTAALTAGRRPGPASMARGRHPAAR